MVPLVIPMVPLAYQWCHWLPMVPLVSQWYQWLPMVPLVKLPLVPLGELRTEPLCWFLSTWMDISYACILSNSADQVAQYEVTRSSLNGSGNLLFLYGDKYHLCTYYMSHCVRKLTFCICENKDADQLRGNREADQRLCFRYLDSTIHLLPKSKISSL